MTGKPSSHVNSTLPLNARCARIAASGGLSAWAQEIPAERAWTSPQTCDRPDPDMPCRAGASGVRPRSASVFELEPNETTIHHNRTIR